MQYCKCGSILIYGVCSNKRCPEADNALREWIIDGAEVKFKEPVTYTEAVKLKSNGSKLIIKPPPPIKENERRNWVNSPTW